MAEQHPVTPEHRQHHTPEQPEAERPAEVPASSEEADKEQTESLEEIYRSVEKHARAASETKTENGEADDAGRSYITRKDKQNALRNSLGQAQRHLPTVSRVFSKFVHSRAVFAASETAAKTIARPSGLLGGGLGAFAGTLALLVFAKKYGFSYNFAAFIVLFSAGFVCGLLAELLIFAVARRRRR